MVVKAAKGPLIYLRRCIEALKRKFQHNIIATKFIYDALVVFCLSLFLFSVYRLLYDLGVNMFFIGMIFLCLLTIFSCMKYRRENFALKFLVAFAFVSISWVLTKPLETDLPIIEYYFAALTAIHCYYLLEYIKDWLCVFDHLFG